MEKQAVWYPTIFPDKCDGCAGFDAPKCVEFCSHKVFGILSGKAIIINPQNCVYGCIACEYVCPRKAIVFPQRITVGERAQKGKCLLKKVKCRNCGKIFWTNEDTDICFDCRK